MIQIKKMSLKGFTLIEILITLGILSIFLSLSLFSLSGLDKNREAGLLAKSIVNRLENVEDLAIVQNKTIHLKIRDNVLIFFMEGDNKKNKSLLTPLHLPSFLSLRFEDPHQEDVLFLANGFIEPFSLKLSYEKNNKTIYLDEKNRLLIQ